MNKKCKQCGLEQPTTEFYKHKETKDRLCSICITCHRENSMAYYWAHPERHAENKRKRKEKYPEKVERQQADAHRKFKYGLSMEDYEVLLKKQIGVCAICNKPCSTGHRLCIDHEHETGGIRGLLCYKCNIAIGHLNDSPALLRKAANYLENAETKKRQAAVINLASPV